jgi:hypothetical protein
LVSVPLHALDGEEHLLARESAASCEGGGEVMRGADHPIGGDFLRPTVQVGFEVVQLGGEIGDEE